MTDLSMNEITFVDGGTTWVAAFLTGLSTTAGCLGGGGLGLGLVGWAGCTGAGLLVGVGTYML